MNAIPNAEQRRRFRLSSWLAPGERQPAPDIQSTHLGDAFRAGDAALYAEVGDFIFTHRLPLSADVFGVVLDYLRGGDSALVFAVQEQLRTTQGLDAAFIRTLAEDRSGTIRPAAVAQMADGLAAQLGRCLTLIGQSRASAQDYGIALDREARLIAVNDGDAIGRLIDLTVQAVATSRRMAEKLEETHRETSLLRDNLDRAQRIAERDHLTGLINRRGFDVRLRARAEADAANDRPWYVAVCDIDDFKAVNDRHGHDTGDRVLKLVARALESDLGNSATVARHGGEEFACLFADSSLDEACAQLNAVRAAIADRSLVNRDTGKPIGALSISIGLAEVHGDPVQAMRDADAALYVAKRSGKNRIATAPIDSE